LAPTDSFAPKEAGQLDDAVPRAYYVLFHAASALLLIDGVRARPHTGVANLIGLHFIARGRLDRHWSQVLGALRGERENGDYGLATFFEADHVAQPIGDARSFLASCETVV
jgi:uncharacterized protein (UPF0332 family)